jgi:hypothetical protein
LIYSGLAVYFLSLLLYRIIFGGGMLKFMRRAGGQKLSIGKIEIRRARAISDK